MQYFQAVQKGKQIAGRSQMKMFEAAGFAMLTLTTKKVAGAFEPVGEEELATVIVSPESKYVAIIVDADGFTKAQSKEMEKQEAMTIFRKLLESGIPEYGGSEIRIWSETRHTVKDDGCD